MNFRGCHRQRHGLLLACAVAIGFSFFGASNGLGQSAPPSVKQSSNRVWSDNSGTFSVEARLLKINSQSVTLRKVNQVVIEVPFNRLSDFDLALVQKEIAKTGSAIARPKQASAIELRNDDSTKITGASAFDDARTSAAVEVGSVKGSPALASDQPLPYSYPSDPVIFSDLKTTERRGAAVEESKKSGLNSEFDIPNNRLTRLPTVSELIGQPATDEVTQPNHETEFQKRPKPTPKVTGLPANVTPSKHSFSLGPSRENSPLSLVSPNTTPLLEPTPKTPSSIDPLFNNHSTATTSKNISGSFATDRKTLPADQSIATNDLRSKPESKTDTPAFNANVSSEYQINPQINSQESLVVGSAISKPQQFAWPNDSQFKPFQESNRNLSNPQPDDTDDSMDTTNAFTGGLSNSSDFQPNGSSDFQPPSSTEIQPFDATEIQPSAPFKFQPPSTPKPLPSGESEFRRPGSSAIKFPVKTTTSAPAPTQKSQTPPPTRKPDIAQAVFESPPRLAPRTATYIDESNLQLVASQQLLSKLPDYLQNITSQMISTKEKAEVLDALTKIKANWPSQRYEVLANLVRQCVDSTDPATRKVAIEILALHDSDLSLEYLAKGIEDENFDVRWTTLKLFEKIADPKFIPTLAQRLDSDDREKVASILESFGSKIEAHVKPFVWHKSVPVQLTACSLLGRVGSGQSLTALQSVATSPQDRKVLLQAEAAIEQIMARSTKN